MKQYKLLHDLPDAFTGDIYSWSGKGYSNETRSATVISKELVERTSDWFEEILPEQGTQDRKELKTEGFSLEEILSVVSEMICDGRFNDKAFLTARFKGMDKEKKIIIVNKDKKVLFTTEDGVDIEQGYNGDLWRVFMVNHSYELWKPYNLGMPQFINSKEEKYFSTEDAAKKYILENKPMFSVKDIEALHIDLDFESTLPEGDYTVIVPNKLIEAAKKKLIQ